MSQQNSVIMKRQFEITTFFSDPEPKRLKITTTTEVSFDDEVATSPNTARPIFADSNGKLYYQKTKREIPQQRHNSGYMKAKVPKAYGEKGHDTVLVHRAIWECFNGLMSPNIEVDHINDDRADNRLCNLQLLSRQDNCKKTTRRPEWINPKHRPIVPVVSTCLDQCQQKEFPSITQAAKALGVNKKSISDIVTGRRQSTKAIDGTRYTFHRA